MDNQQYSDDSITTISTPATVFVTESPILLVAIVQRISRRDIAVQKGQRTLRCAFPAFPAVLMPFWHKDNGLVSQLAGVELSEVSKILRLECGLHTADWVKTL